MTSHMPAASDVSDLRVTSEMGSTSASSVEKQQTAGGRKRSRITQACRRCKSRKARCDGVQPVCGECMKGNAICEQPDPVEDGRKKRKAKAGQLEGNEHRETQHTSTQESQTSPLGLSDGAGTHSLSPDLFTFPQTSTASSSSLFYTSQSSGSGSSALPILADAAAMPAASSYLQGVQYDASPNLPASGVLNGDSFAGADGPASRPVPSLQYLRPFGPTAIQPGLEQINVSIQAPPAISRAQSPNLDNLAPDFLPSFVNPPLNQHDSQVPSFSFMPPSRVDRLFEEGSDLPRPEIQAELFDVFFKRLGSHFPFLSRRSLDQLVNSDQPTSVDVPMLVNSICAVAARFSTSPAVKGPDPGLSPALYGMVFADKAKSMLVPLLGYPSTSTVQSIIFLTWHDFGLNSEGGLWGFTGMALRMAQDLGLHLDIEHQHGNAQTQAINRLTWWAVLVLDRMLSIGTGRPVTIKSSEVSALLPTDDDIFLVSGIESPLPSPFPAYCQQMLLYGDMCDIINNVKGKWKNTMSSEPPSRGEPNSSGEDQNLPLPSQQTTDLIDLKALEDVITKKYADLSTSLAWSSSNFRKHHDAGLGPIYLHLHIWYNGILIMLYAPPLIYPKTNAAELSLADRLAVVTHCSLQISQMIGIADLVDVSDYEAAPFVNQCFFLASSAWVKDYHIRTGRSVLATSSAGGPSRLPPTAPTGILAQGAISNFSLCQEALSKQTKYWLGVGWIGALANRKGLKSSKSSIRTATEGLHTLVSGPEMAVLRRLAQRISGTARTPELDSETLSALFNIIHTDGHSDGLATQNYQFTPDDFALAYTFASSFPDIAQQ